VDALGAPRRIECDRVHQRLQLHARAEAHATVDRVAVLPLLQRARNTRLEHHLRHVVRAEVHTEFQLLFHTFLVAPA
jgi:hypothetical protein